MQYKNLYGRNAAVREKLSEHDRHVLGEAEIIKQIGDNRYLAEVNGVRCTAIFNFFTGFYYVDDVYGVLKETDNV